MLLRSFGRGSQGGCCRYFGRNNIPNLTLIVYIWLLEFVSTLSFVEAQSYYVQIILFWKQRISLLLMKQLLTVHTASDLSLINYERAWISIWYHIVFIAFTKPFIYLLIVEPFSQHWNRLLKSLISGWFNVRLWVQNWLVCVWLINNQPGGFSAFTQISINYSIVF